ncbi:MAG: hypothetical protein J6P33_05615 [Spirochaetales bacterium]|nr:hypothetical protein [Spirochaetales bacterium]
MNVLERLVSSQGFDNMVISVCFWVILYVVVKVFTVKSGVGDLLKYAYKRTEKLGKKCLQLGNLCTAKDASSKLDSSVKVLKKVIKAQKRTSKIMNMYLFDDRGDMDVASAKGLVERIPDLCRDAIVKVAENNTTDVESIFDNIENNIKTAKELLKKASVIDKKKELLQV